VIAAPFAATTQRHQIYKTEGANAAKETSMRIVRFVPMVAIPVATGLLFGGTAVAGGVYGSAISAVQFNPPSAETITPAHYKKHQYRGHNRKRRLRSHRRHNPITITGTGRIFHTGGPITAMAITGPTATTGPIPATGTAGDRDTPGAAAIPPLAFSD
jgi:hypothetical protein